MDICLGKMREMQDCGRVLKKGCLLTHSPGKYTANY
jgi:hypothetical protein